MELLGLRRVARAAAAVAAAIALITAGTEAGHGPVSPATAHAADLPIPWPAPGSPPLPPDLTIPYLPAVNPVCVTGGISCFLDLQTILRRQTRVLGCDHDAVFADAYVTVTQALIKASTTAGYFDRPDRINHEARQYAQEYLDQFRRFHSGDRARVSPAWQIAFQAAEDQSVSSMGDLLLQLNAHIRRDNPIRAVEQSEGVLRVAGPMPAASGRADHERISDVLQSTLKRMLDRLAKRYDPTIDDGADLFGMLVDQQGLYALISVWREESWRNGEQLRHARANGGVSGDAYKRKLAEIEESARLGAEVIRLETLTTPTQNAQRNAFCAAHVRASATAGA
jgi:hypothetical protein